MFSLRSLICFLGMFVGVMSSANAQFHSFGHHYNFNHSYGQSSYGGHTHAAPAYAAPQAYYRVPVVIYPSSGGQQFGSGLHSAVPAFGNAGLSYGQSASRTKVRTVRVVRISRPAPVVYQAPVIQQAPQYYPAAQPACGCVN